MDRVNAVLIARAKDADNFPCDVLEDPLTGKRMLAYSPEDWWAKGELAKLRNARRRDLPSGSPRNAWPPKLKGR